MRGPGKRRAGGGTPRGKMKDGRRSSGAYMLEPLLVPRIAQYSEHNDLRDVARTVEYLRHNYKEYQRRPLAAFTRMVERGISEARRRSAAPQQQASLLQSLEARHLHRRSKKSKGAGGSSSGGAGSVGACEGDSEEGGDSQRRSGSDSDSSDEDDNDDDEDDDEEGSRDGSSSDDSEDDAMYLADHNILNKSLMTTYGGTVKAGEAPEAATTRGAWSGGLEAGPAVPGRGGADAASAAPMPFAAPDVVKAAALAALASQKAAKASSKGDGRSDSKVDAGQAAAGGAEGGADAAASVAPPAGSKLDGHAAEGGECVAGLLTPGAAPAARDAAMEAEEDRAHACAAGDTDRGAPETSAMSPRGAPPPPLAVRELAQAPEPAKRKAERAERGSSKKKVKRAKREQQHRGGGGKGEAADTDWREGAGASQGARRSKKASAGSEPKAVRFQDLGGIEGALRDIRELIVYPLMHPEVYHWLGVEPPRGVLLHGPPGCGKTMLANAIAHEMGVPFFRIAGPEVVSGMSGESEAKVRSLFADAVEAAPCIIFIDEIDAITPKRETAQREMERRIVAQLLACMDDLSTPPPPRDDAGGGNGSVDKDVGASNKDKGDKGAAPREHKHVVVIGATNRPDALDPALRRAGRFDREISMGIPDEAARVRILQVLAGRLRLEGSFNFASIARRTPGYVGADLSALTKEAAVIAINRIFSSFVQGGEAASREARIVETGALRGNSTGAMMLQEDAADASSEPPRKKLVDATSAAGHMPAARHAHPPGDVSSTQTVVLSAQAWLPGRADREQEDVATSGVAAASSHALPAGTAMSSAGAAPQRASPMDVAGDVGGAREDGAAMGMSCQAVAGGGDEGRHPHGHRRPSAALAPGMSGGASNFGMAASGGEGGGEAAAVPIAHELQVLRDFSERASVPLTPAQMDGLYVTMADFEEAVHKVQPSAKREGFSTIPDVTWEDVGSLWDVREELSFSIAQPIASPERFHAMGLSLATGVLLFGPPGCGKTLVAKAIANECHANFISIKGPELLNKYVGESERAVRQLFSRARASAPCILFFDEMDAMAPRRGTDGNQAAERVVNQLLTEMDGLESRQSVYLIAATNRPDMLDPALLRPGRLDKLLYVPLPPPDGRVSILRALTRPVPLGEDVDVAVVGNSARCEGFSGADLAALVREACVCALKEDMPALRRPAGGAMVPAIDAAGPRLDRQGAPRVHMRHFEAAWRKVSPSVSRQDSRRYEDLSRKIGCTRAHINNDRDSDKAPVADPPLISSGQGAS
eukprot:jgi/Mesvir1/3648/Mv14943-RA.1